MTREKFPAGWVPFLVTGSALGVIHTLMLLIGLPMQVATLDLVEYFSHPQFREVGVGLAIFGRVGTLVAFTVVLNRVAMASEDPEWNRASLRWLARAGLFYAAMFSSIVFLVGQFTLSWTALSYEDVESETSRLEGLPSVFLVAIVLVVSCAVGAGVSYFVALVSKRDRSQLHATDSTRNR